MVSTPRYHVSLSTVLSFKQPTTLSQQIYSRLGWLHLLLMAWYERTAVKCIRVAMNGF
jgi:hypothetical protein